MERMTQQGEAIRRVFTESDLPLGLQDTLKAAQKYAPSLGIATVYRTIKVLLADGWLLPVNLPGQSPRYISIDKPHQHYFQCRICVMLFPVDCPMRSLTRLAPSGFRLEGHEMVLYGLCPTCQAI